MFFKKETLKFESRVIQMEPWLHIDCLKYEDGRLTLAGWIHFTTNIYDELKLYIVNKQGESILPIQYRLVRDDVSETLKSEDYKHSGFLVDLPLQMYFNFYLVIKVINRSETIAVSLVGKIGLGFVRQCRKIRSKINKDNVKRLCFFIRHGRLKELIEVLNKPQIVITGKSERRIDLQAGLTLLSSEYSCKTVNQVIDIIVPVYNGFEYLEKLFESIEHTNMTHRVIIVNDCSTDHRVNQYLKKMVNSKKGYLLIENSVNQGFVKSVNIALNKVKNHVALVNTDVEVPYFWLERLMNPILNETKIASSTPYTNCGVICSFPEIIKDNEIYLNLSLKEIDDIFQKLHPRYVELPTGVGFCMGMNFNVLNKIGNFDEKSFGKGYGEENDWCQRAVKEGYKNVQVENLFVYHKHGGSFLTEEKQQLMQENGEKIKSKYPNYYQDVAEFIDRDVNRDIRELVKLILKNKCYKGNFELVFTHNLGGGADIFLKKRIKKEHCENPNKIFVVVYYMSDNDRYCIDFIGRDEIIKAYTNHLNELKLFLSYCKISGIHVNELVTYPKLYETLKTILDIKKEVKEKLVYYLHDYYSICPEIYLMNKHKFCNVPEINVCKQCYSSNNDCNITDWRQNWGRFLDNCDEIIAFSQDSKKLINKSYPNVEKIIIRPHDCSYMIPIEKKYKRSEEIVIGILGILSYHKGLEIIKKIVTMIEEQNLRVRVVLIGYSLERIDSKFFYETGEYKISELPRRVIENDIDVFFIASLCPETFSYTAEEVMKMELPIVSFDLGASAERIKNYKKGEIIKEIDAKKALDTVMETAIEYRLPMRDIIKQKILILIESYTFSTRYRMDHLSEMLQLQGFIVEILYFDEFKECNSSNYKKVILYRLPYSIRLCAFINKCNNHGIPVVYDIDDYIFNYSAIQDLGFLKDVEYRNFKEYSTNIYKAMQLCDVYLTSTETLATQIKTFFKRKVCVLRNVASMELEILSRIALENKQSGRQNIILGYFSGSKTHNKDFQQIEDIILDIMKSNKRVFLKIGGVLELSKKFELVEKQIIRIPFMNWKKLPEQIAGIDINLMPLEDTIFHTCKSENKWMEAALVNVVTIASENIELKNIIRHEIDGILCKTKDDWEKQLKKLITNKEYRIQIAKQAHIRVNDEYLTRKMQFKLEEIMNEI